MLASALVAAVAYGVVTSMCSELTFVSPQFETQVRTSPIAERIGDSRPVFATTDIDVSDN